MSKDRPRKKTPNAPAFKGTTIAEAKKYLRAHFANHMVQCPCCGQAVHLYKRQIHATMAKMLIRLVKMTESSDAGQVWFDIKDIVRAAGHGTTGTYDFSKLMFWGLVMQHEKDPSDTTRRQSALWRATDVGILFVHNKIRIPKYVYIYNNRLQKNGGEEIGTMDALTDNFNYQELMTNEE